MHAGVLRRASKTYVCVCRYGTEEQRRHWLPQLTSLQAFSSYCLTEPGSGSDAASLTTAAKRDGSDYVITVCSCGICT